jgi:hypothetical protein
MIARSHVSAPAPCPWRLVGSWTSCPQVQLGSLLFHRSFHDPFTLLEGLGPLFTGSSTIAKKPFTLPNSCGLTCVLSPFNRRKVASEVSRLGLGPVTIWRGRSRFARGQSEPSALIP